LSLADQGISRCWIKRTCAERYLEKGARCFEAFESGSAEMLARAPEGICFWIETVTHFEF
jgi:hypothetical protein